MALTRKSLKAMGLTDEQVDSIIEMHTETTEGLKAKIETLEAGAKDLPKLQKQLEQMKADLETAQKDGWKEKHDSVKKEFDAYKKAQTDKESKAAKEAAARAYFESKNIVGKYLELAMRGSRDEIAALTLEDGKIKDTSALDALVAGDFAGLVGTTTVRGANTATPPANAGGGAVARDDIMKIKDPVERQTAIAKNINLFRKE